jgi:hypothetical protein
MPRGRRGWEFFDRLRMSGGIWGGWIPAFAGMTGESKNDSITGDRDCRVAALLAMTVGGGGYGAEKYPLPC